MTAILKFWGQWVHWRYFHSHHVKEHIKIPMYTKFHPFILKIAKIGPLLGENNKKIHPLLRKIFFTFLESLVSETCKKQISVRSEDFFEKMSFF